MPHTDTTTASPRVNARNALDPTPSVSDELAILKEDIAQLTADMKNVGTALFDKGKDAATVGYDETAERITTSIDTCSRAVGERPFTSMLVALGAGLVIGKFMLGGRG